MGRKDILLILTRHILVQKQLKNLNAPKVVLNHMPSSIITDCSLLSYSLRYVPFWGQQLCFKRNMMELALSI